MKLFFFGDSICVGQHVSVEKIWVHNVATNLRKSYPDLLVMNPSISGNTTRMALERMYFDVISHNPDILYIQFGLNDCNVWATDAGCERVSPDAYIANLSEMIQKAYAAGCKKVILNTNHPSGLNKSFLANRDITYESNNKLYYQRLCDFQAQIKNIISIDIRSHIESLSINPETYLLEDGIHLNENGHKIYFQYIIQFLKNAISETYK